MIFYCFCHDPPPAEYNSYPEKCEIRTLLAATGRRASTAIPEPRILLHDVKAIG